jgi:hypothetical protein
MYAPVMITVYNRLEHLRACITSLLRCEEAPETILYIASDAAYRGEDLEGVERVREYIRSISGFREVRPIFQDRNMGMEENYYSSVDLVFREFESIIVMEDDVVVGKGFLRFINEGLVKYRDEPRVISICGYMMPGGEGVEAGPYFLNEKTPYGEGLWRHKESVAMSFQTPALAQEFMTNWRLFKAMEMQSPDNVRALPVIARGEVVAYDIQSMLGMIKHDLLALFPPCTLTKSLGHDGSGLHAAVNDHLQSQEVFDGDVLIPEALPLMASESVANGIMESQSSPLVMIVNRIIFVGYNFIPGFYLVFRRCRALFKMARRALSV